MEKYQLYLTRCDAALNMQRYYQLSLERTLFGGLVLTRRWGRIGSLGKSRHQEVETEIRGLEVLLQVLKAKRRRGYAANGGGFRNRADLQGYHQDVCAGRPRLKIRDRA